MTMRFSILTLGDNYEHLRPHEQFYHEVLEEAEYAEELGYEGFWVGEHHFQASQRVFPSPQMILAAIAQRTKKLRLGNGRKNPQSLTLDTLPTPSLNLKIQDLTLSARSRATQTTEPLTTKANPLCQP